ncbi:EscS/YscS/HrcS family type III secretion system export apparatus protein [Proteus mirabilis]|uniref:EscS/YscS/HrcS family type III secretion system export apparatus protein n=1 Tax=Proteus mirabilis TaxID=584 RepID=UPI00234B2040|nr:EscS/YscS/HrcS family type III secretion system export apparatus protein [Proteus mirabilis]MDC5886296.1 EscS/YscS/HrcS family type III secretion system export apparatus protein [Proteus mirabilis]MDC5903893.1 EscS/YscS/HrcS family type III secretion system export apparatus protein [Proteus mirabilis]MDC5907443.1 EscS/YscS/HrcS family type III secretion system export apparatus protein [Proteus mirabilis]MDC5921550.1 EscS/YscS/HrcS family type III secretion system export apparatus protein [Pr
MDITYVANKALYLVIILSIVPVAVATLVGLIIGLFQTVTQVQEQTLPFGLKLIAVFVCLLIQAGWLGEKMLNYSKEILTLALAGS